jgi:hypothetical protein
MNLSNPGRLLIRMVASSCCWSSGAGYEPLIKWRSNRGRGARFRRTEAVLAGGSVPETCGYPPFKRKKWTDYNPDDPGVTQLEVTT